MEITLSQRVIAIQLLLTFLKTFGNSSDGIGMDLGQDEIQKSPPTLKEAADISGQTEHT